MIVQCQKPKSQRRREKTDIISMEYLEWRLSVGCPLCRAQLKQCSTGKGDIFFVCPTSCLADDGSYYYVSIHGEKRYEQALDQKLKGSSLFV